MPNRPKRISLSLTKEAWRKRDGLILNRGRFSVSFPFNCRIPDTLHHDSVAQPENGYYRTIIESSASLTIRNPNPTSSALHTGRSLNKQPSDAKPPPA
ncbi:hypothetical protein QE152_g26382 [Popillia japonica]|uniref:Uncharacterized protein n=1 Tax=Popillia japonica TaxID=7064 RepID=A0AAW1JXS4_POPJA